MIHVINHCHHHHHLGKPIFKCRLGHTCIYIDAVWMILLDTFVIVVLLFIYLGAVIV